MRTRDRGVPWRALGLPVLICAGAAVPLACVPDVSQPATPEVCDNARDDDGNGAVDCADIRCIGRAECLASSACGNDRRETGEICDGADLDGQTCERLGFLVGALACTTTCDGFDTSACIRRDTCGNGVREGAEECDGSVPQGVSCRARGFGSGDLACNDALCLLDESGCQAADSCGNNTLDDGELCDGASLPPGASCASEGFHAGTIACNDTCSGFDTSGCTNCGDGALSAGEVCDGIVLGDESCASQGFVSGTLACTAACDAFDTSLCTLCGNDALDPGETCDGSALGGASCSTQGFFTGSLGCSRTCDAFVTTGCTNCGDGTVGTDELCDTGVALTETCAGLGYADGTLACALNCSAYDVSDCSGFSGCGDGAIDGLEFCDPSAGPWFLEYSSYSLPEGFPLWSGSCDVYGFAGLGDGTGTERFTCTADCQLDISSCTGAEISDYCAKVDLYGDGLYCNPCDRLAGSVDPDCEVTTCGNGVAEGGYAAPGYPGMGFEWCDGSDLRSADCTFYGFVGGTLACRPDCQYDFSDCTPSDCGDTIVQGREVCDTTVSVTCADFGYGTGTPNCDPSCLVYDFTPCSGYTPCGDGLVSGTEVCDTAAPVSATCADFGYAGGNLGCRSDCQGFTFNGCQGFAECGNGALDGLEFCDPTSGPRFLEYFSYTEPDGFPLWAGYCDDYVIGDNSGTELITCTADCQWDLSSCTGGGSGDFCTEAAMYGDGTYCDPCDRLGGTPDPDCASATCGDGVADGTFAIPGYPGVGFEWCDDTDLRGADCLDYNFAGGTLRCRPDCQYDFSDCTPSVCGDGVVNGREACEPTSTCTDLGYTGGTVACAPDCLAVSGCN